eukprot:scaffold273225_cov28-Tisochrysis_lutea.AAC.1
MRTASQPRAAAQACSSTFQAALSTTSPQTWRPPSLERLAQGLSWGCGPHRGYSRRVRARVRAAAHTCGGRAGPR